MHSSDSQMKAFLSKWSIGGASMAITKNGKLIYNRAFGFTDIAKQQATQPSNLFRIASVSKPITAIAIMKMIEDGKLNINDTVFGAGKILDQAYYLSVIIDSRIYNITVKQLLEHTAGWDRGVACDGYTHCDPISFPLHVTSTLGAQNPAGDSVLIKFLLKKGLNSAPGTAYAYSNIGYLVLGKVIEKLSGMKYEDYVETKIFDPLGLCDMHLGKNLLADKQEREVEYNASNSTLSCYGNGQSVPWQYGGWNLEAMNAHGGWIATAADLTKLILAVDKYSTFPDILTSASITTMTTPSSVNAYYAKGWSVNTFGNWWHTGSLDGTATFIARTSGGYTWAILLNSRSTASNAFWSDLDALPWDCIAATSSFPTHNLYPPTLNVSSLNAVVASQTSATLTWSAGDGDGRIIVATELSSLKDFPEDGNSYAGNSTYGSGSKIGNSTYVVYKGQGNTTTVTNLDKTKTYLFSGFEYFKNSFSGNYEIYKMGCRSSVSVNTAPAGIKTSSINSSIRLFPDPSSNIINVSSDRFTGEVNIRITDLLGKVVLDRSNISMDNLQLNISGYDTGVYYLEISEGAKVERVRFVKN